MGSPLRTWGLGKAQHALEKTRFQIFVHLPHILPWRCAWLLLGESGVGEDEGLVNHMLLEEVRLVVKRSVYKQNAEQGEEEAG